jgi:ribosome-associated protein
LNSKQLAEEISGIMFSKKGYDVKLLDLQNVTTMTDYFLICSADSDTQVKAISDEIEKNLRDQGIKCWHREGYKALNWILLDYVDLVVHVFKKDAREFYNLEKLWGDAVIIEMEDPLVIAAEKKAAKKVVRKSAKSTSK